MKKVIFMLVVMMAAISASAQMVVKETPVTFTLVNGYVYDRTQVPGGTWVRAGEDVNSGINRYFMDLRGRNAAEAQRQYNAFIMAGGLNGITPIDIVSTTVMGGGGLMMGGGAVMMGGAAGMGGMVYGNGGMAGANSNVIIDNQNMMSTVGSGLQMYYDTGSNSVSLSGDPLMAAGRLINFIGGSKKTRRQQTTTNNAGNGNVRVVYIDANTGQQVAAPSSNTRSSGSTPTTTTRSTHSGAATSTSYNFASGF